jgi:NhaP-type Na+/H+ or K+/H+ antiporter
MSDETLVLALIVASATASQLIAARIGVPAIVPLLAAGALLGASGLDLLQPSELLGDLLEPFIDLAVGVILLEGALTLRRRDLLAPGIGSVILRLITLGVLITWALGTLGATLIFDIDIRIALILGAVLTLSGPTVVLPLLDFVRPRGEIGTVLRWEGILIDPVGAILAVLTFHAIASGHGEFEVGTFAATLAVGAAIGVVAAYLVRFILNSDRYNEALKSVTMIGMALSATAAANAIFADGGLVAAVAMGITLANNAQVSEETVSFTETLVALLIGALFVVLAAGVEVDSVVSLGLKGLLFLALLILLVRPLSAGICAAGSRLRSAERAFLAWMMPRGIVAAATVSTFQVALEQYGVPDAEMLTPITFLVIAGTVLVYGLTARPLALWLGLAEDGVGGGAGDAAPGARRDAPQAERERAMG